jgi:hypothetical protein
MDKPERIFAPNHQIFYFSGMVASKRIYPESDDSVARDGSFAIVKCVSHFTTVVAIGICMFGQRILVRICMYHFVCLNGIGKIEKNQVIQSSKDRFISVSLEFNVFR